MHAFEKPGDRVAIAYNIKAGAGRSHEPGIQFGSPTWMARIQALEPSPAALSRCSSRKLESVAELKVEARHITVG